MSEVRSASEGGGGVAPERSAGARGQQQTSEAVARMLAAVEAMRVRVKALEKRA